MENKMKYPGEEFANEHGYTLHSHNEAKTHIDFVKSVNPEFPVHLDLLPSGEWTLTKIIGMVVCKIGPFSLPNKNFEIFEEKIENIKSVPYPLDSDAEYENAVKLVESHGFMLVEDPDW
jgi:hypothetical protein